MRTAREAVDTASDAADLVHRLDALAEVVKTHKLPARTADRLRREALELAAKRGDEVGDAARALLRGDDATRLGGDAADAAGGAAGAAKPPPDAGALSQQLGSSTYDKLKRGGLSDADIDAGVRAMGADALANLSKNLHDAGTLRVLENLVGWRALGRLNLEMKADEIISWLHTVGDKDKLRALKHLGDDGLEAFARLDNLAKNDLLKLPESTFAKVASKLPTDSSKFIAAWRKHPDPAFLERVLDTAKDPAAALRMVSNLDADRMAKLRGLAPEQFSEVMKRDGLVMDAIGSKSPAEQGEVFDKIRSIDDVYTPRGGPSAGTPRAAPSGEPARSAPARRRAVQAAQEEGHIASTWQSWDAAEDAIATAKRNAKDGAWAMSVRGTDACPINANGLAKIDRTAHLPDGHPQKVTAAR